MKRALVLAGGGSRGAYEFGAWTALREQNVTYEIVTGTSIGAVNGALIVQDEFDLLRELWNNITVDGVMASGLNFSYSLEGILSQKESIPAFLRSYFQSGGADITPFKNLLNQVLNEELFFASEVDYGLITVQVPNLTPVQIKKSDIQPGYLAKWVLASASCFPAFPLCEIDGQNYIDGGYYDNLPIDTAIRLGADEIIAIGLSPQVVHPQYENRPIVTHIRPTRDLGSFLLFEREIIQNNITLGYNDAMKALGVYQGFGYTFTAEDPARFAGPAENFLTRIARLESGELQPGETILSKYKRSAWLTECLNKVGLPKNQLEGLICGIEVTCELLGVTPYPVYPLEQMGEKFEQLIQHPTNTKMERNIARVLDAKRMLAGNAPREALLALAPRVCIAAILLSEL